MLLHHELTTRGFAGDKRPSVSAVRALVSVVVMALAALAVYLLADWVHLRTAFQEFGAKPWLLVALVITYTGAFWLRAIAWRSLIVHRVGLYRLFVPLQAGLLVNHLAPVKLGEFVRPLLAARYGVPIAEAATTTAVARVLDFAVLLVIAMSVGPFILLTDGGEFWLRGLALSMAVIVGFGGGLLLIRRGHGQQWMPGPLRPRFGDFQSQLKQVSGRQIAVAALFTLPSWILEAGVVFVAAKALGIELSIAAAIAVTAFTILFQVFHVTPGGIGVYEAVMTGALYAHGISLQEGLALAVATHGLKFAYSYSVSLLFTLTAAGSCPS